VFRANHNLEFCLLFCSAMTFGPHFALGLPTPFERERFLYPCFHKRQPPSNCCAATSPTKFSPLCIKAWGRPQNQEMCALRRAIFPPGLSRLFPTLAPEKRENPPLYRKVSIFWLSHYSSHISLSFLSPVCWVLGHGRIPLLYIFIFSFLYIQKPFLRIFGCRQTREKKKTIPTHCPLLRFVWRLPTNGRPFFFPWNSKEKTFRPPVTFPPPPLFLAPPPIFGGHRIMD